MIIDARTAVDKFDKTIEKLIKVITLNYDGLDLSLK